MRKNASARALACLLLLSPVASFSGESSWQPEWEKSVAQANQEGQVTIYYQDSKEYLFERFQKAFPKIKILSVFGARGADLASRVMAERRAGKYLADVYYVGAETHVSVLYPAKVLEPLPRVLILPEVTDETKWFQGKHHYADPERRYSFRFEGSVSGGLAYNSRLVKEREILSYWDMLHPRWKGKIVAFDPRPGGHATAAFWFLYKHDSLGPEFLRRLFLESDLALSRDFRQPVDWLATGRYLFCYACQGIEDAERQGLPIGKMVHSLKEGTHLAPRGSVVALLTRAPHPNAGKVFVNWLLSREGQIAFQKMYALQGRGVDSLRIDIPKDEVLPDGRRREGANYFMEDVTERIRGLPEMRQMIDDLLAKRKGK